MKLKQLNLFENNGATFSPCRLYRYVLWRIWDESRPLIMFIGLNPSKASEAKPDPTITRVKGFCESWGYGGFYMINLFAYVSEKPKRLLQCADPLGDNDGWLERIAPKCQKVVFCWGAFKEAKQRARQVIAMFPDAETLVFNKDGSPKHPLYILGENQLQKFNSTTCKEY